MTASSAWCAFLAAALLTVADVAAAAVDADGVRRVVANLNLDSSATGLLSCRISEAPDRTEWIVESDSDVYAVAVDAQTLDGIEADDPIRGRLELGAGRIALARAKQALFLYGAGKGFQDRGYRNRESMANALIALDGMSTTTTGRLGAGLQSAVQTSGTIGVGAVWVDSDSIADFRRHLPDNAEFAPVYCAELYATARIRMKAGDWMTALDLFKEIHDLKWTNIEAYLDAAECFDRTGDPAGAAKLLGEVWETLGPGMKPQEAERMGDHLLRFGVRGPAREAFEAALHGYRIAGSNDALPQTANRKP